MEINLGESRLIQNPNQVFHDSTLRGKGTKESPLQLGGLDTFAPSAPDDSFGFLGQITADDDFIYVKTSAG